MALPGHAVTIKAGITATAMVDEACTEVTGFLFQVTDAARRILDPRVAIVVESGGVPVDPSLYEVDELFGEITFTTNRTGETITLTGSFLPVFSIAEARSIDPTFTREQEDKTIIGDDARSMLALLETVTGTIESLDIGNTDIDTGGGTLTFGEVVRNGTPLILEYSPDGGTNGYRAWVKLESLNPTAAFDAIVTNSYSLQPSHLSPGAHVWGYGALT